MRQLVQKMLKQLRLSSRRAAKPARRPWKVCPDIEVLEDRSVPQAVTASGALTGVAFIDSAHTGALSGASTPTPGMTIDLTGITTSGSTVSMTATTDADGVYNFLDLEPGTYQVNMAAGQNALTGSASTASGIVITSDNVSTQNMISPGMAPSVISLRMFLTTSTSADLPFQPFNDTPTVKTAISNVSVAANAAATNIDLAANFTDAALTNTILQFNTNYGPIDEILDDAGTPQTVANFMDYVESGAYDSSVFHRLGNSENSSSTPAVAQGGGFTFQSSPLQISTIPTGPAVADEDGVINNVQGSLAMANAGANTGTDQFYFNLANNTGLDTSAGADFTVFGQITGSGSQATLTALGNLPVPLNTNNILTSSDVFVNMPLANTTGLSLTGFPSGDGTGPYALPAGFSASNFALVNNVQVVSRPDFLTYSIVGNTNPGLVTPTLSNERLSLNYTAGQTGTSTITVQATDKFGATATTSFTVTVT